jgi:hypothetical protein
VTSITSVGQFIDIILNRTPASEVVTTYRGHGFVEYVLQPSIFRTQLTRRNEHVLLRELIAAHPEDFHGDTSALEILVRMQHYTLPTRLLDVSLNPLVALYFACEIVKKRVPVRVNGKPVVRTREMDGHVITLQVDRARMRYFDSDTVSCLTNLAQLSWDYKSKIKTSEKLEAFNETTPIKRLLHFIRQDKNGFLSEIEPSDLDGVFLVKPKQNNKRILAQAGAFFVFGLTEEIHDDNLDGITVDRLIVKADAKRPMLAELDKLGINEKTMFPEIDRAARYITGSLSTGDAASKLVS